MSGLLYVLFFLISFVASVAGAICGIGGGVIIKPALELFGAVSVSTISFLSGCTVLAMSCYSMVKNKRAGQSLVNAKTGTPLAAGAAVGGIAGKLIFQYIAGQFADKEMIGVVQAGCLLLITLGTLIYTVKKETIVTRRINSMAVCLSVGVVLGILSSFLGIGGGPINLVVLFYFFSMDTKAAAQNSLYIILFSQITSLLSTVATGNVPDFSLWLLLLMVVGGVLGGAFGRMINRKIESRIVDHLFIALMCIIIGINMYNIYRFMV